MRTTERVMSASFPWILRNGSLSQPRHLCLRRAVLDDVRHAAGHALLKVLVCLRGGRWTIRAVVPEQVVMRMTGHKTRSVFERYNIVSGGDLKEAAKKLDERAATVTATAISGTQSHPIPANSNQARIMPIAQGLGA